MSLHSYQAAQRATENPRNAEYRLFAQVTRALMNIGDSIDPQAHQALDWNRRLWLTLQMDLANDANVLPDQLKAQLISLSLWVDRYTSKVMHGEALVRPLIDVNRSVMDGLAQGA